MAVENIPSARVLNSCVAVEGFHALSIALPESLDAIRTQCRA